MNTKLPKQKLALTRQIVARLTPLSGEQLRLAGGGSSSVHINNWSTPVCGCPKQN
jgi:hypothetical protein